MKEFHHVLGKQKIGFITLKGQIEEEDILHFTKEQVEVVGVGIDFMSDYNNSIRIKGQFQRDHSAQSFKITRIPVVKGNIVNVPLDLCEMYRPIEIMLNEYQ